MKTVPERSEGPPKVEVGMKCPLRVRKIRPLLNV